MTLYSQIDQECIPELLEASEENSFGPEFDSGTYHGDASGGEFTPYPLLRRRSVGLVQVSDEAILIGAHSSTLPGPIQTVPKGELFVISCQPHGAQRHAKRVLGNVGTIQNQPPYHP